jgi:hypothetical protein
MKVNIYASYAFEFEEAGSLSLGVTDYTNPNREQSWVI